MSAEKKLMELLHTAVTEMQHILHMLVILAHKLDEIKAEHSVMQTARLHLSCFCQCRF